VDTGLEQWIPTYDKKENFASKPQIQEKVRREAGWPINSHQEKPNISTAFE